MSGRFERLYQLPGNLYSDGSPLLFVAGALQKDTQTGYVVVQLRLRNVSPLPIKAAKVSILAYDITGRELQGVDEYQYLDLSADTNKDFGSNKAIMMPDANTRSFEISSATVVFDDGNTREVSMPMTALPKPIPLKTHLENSDLVKQYQSEINSMAEFVPRETPSLWQCSCGQWNRNSTGAVCAKCQATKTDVFNRCDSSYLMERFTERTLKEMEIQARSEEEKAADKASKRKLVGVVAIAVAVVCALCLLYVLGSSSSEATELSVEETCEILKECYACWDDASSLVMSTLTDWNALPDEPTEEDFYEYLWLYEDEWENMGDKISSILSGMDSAVAASGYEEYWDSVYTLLGELKEVANDLSDWDTNGDSTIDGTEAKELLVDCSDRFVDVSTEYLVPIDDFLSSLS